MANEHAHDPAMRDQSDAASGVHLRPVVDARLHALEEIVQRFASRRSLDRGIPEPRAPGSGRASLELPERQASPLSALELTQARVVRATQSTRGTHTSRQVLGPTQPRRDHGSEIRPRQEARHARGILSPALRQWDVDGTIDSPLPLWEI